MGTWGKGLLDSDAACDALGDLCDQIVSDIVRLGDAPDATDELCAAVGVLLQLSAYDFRSRRGTGIVTATQNHATQIERLSADAQRVMRRVMAGEGAELAEQPDPDSAVHADIFKKGARTSRFGERHPDLFQNPRGAAYVQSIANRCVESIEEELRDEGTWSDLCREAGSMGLLGVLAVLAPCSVPRATIESWNEKARKGLAELRQRKDDDLEFHEAYYANLDRAFDILAARFAG